MTKGQHIDFIDLAKGICIILVLLFHCRIGEEGITSYLRMPLYFCLSGIFFKDYGGFFNLLKKKTNKLLIPFVFFYILPWPLNYVCECIQPGFWTHHGSFFGDLWHGWYLNGPIWFLIALFWCNLSFYFIQKYINKKLIPFVIAVFAVIGGLLAYKESLCPLYIFTPFLALPYFYVGNIIRHSSIICSEKSWRELVVALVLIIVVWLLNLFSDEYISFVGFRIEGNLLIYYAKSFLMVVAALLICKYIDHLPVVSYCGRYSIIILGTHLIFRDILWHLPNWIGDSVYIPFIQFVAVFALSNLSIPIFRRLFPYFTAQKDLLK